VIVYCQRKILKKPGPIPDLLFEVQSGLARKIVRKKDQAWSGIKFQDLKSLYFISKTRPVLAGL